MKKLVLSIALVAGLNFVASAQTEGAVKKLSIGAEFGISTNRGIKDIVIAGGSIQFEQPVAKSLNLIFSTGYLSQMITGDLRDAFKAFGLPTSLGMIPIKAGAKYYFNNNFYGAGDAGVAISVDGGGTAFIFGPSLGASFSIADKSSLDFGLRYGTWTTSRSLSFLGIRAAYAFGL
ncbi:hypothetical protein ACHMWN_10035 [Pedobacter sp. UC225_61]|uniref:hypothetical protein n=1 Tax=Pedobacter sp. UC225_61 TaxID=3374623 RepID=UPI003789D27A